MATFRFGTASDEQAVNEYAEFEEKVKRTVFLSELSPAINSPVIEKALNQFGDVVSIEIIPNLTIPNHTPLCALVEMKDPKQVEAVVKVTTDLPFMMSGMPRPIRAQAAKAEMFADRPSKPGRMFEARWVGRSDPDFEVGTKMKQLCKQHTAETLALTKLTMAEEAKLAKIQAESLDGFYRKYELTGNIKKDASSLSSLYQMNLRDDD